MLVNQWLISHRERVDRERSEVRSRVLKSARNTLSEGTLFDLTMQRPAREAGLSRQTMKGFPWKFN